LFFLPSYFLLASFNTLYSARVKDAARVLSAFLMDQGRVQEPLLDLEKSAVIENGPVDGQPPEQHGMNKTNNDTSPVFLLEIR
jgi:hypothetical protein